MAKGLLGRRKKAFTMISWRWVNEWKCNHLYWAIDEMDTLWSEGRDLNLFKLFFQTIIPFWFSIQPKPHAVIDCLFLRNWPIRTAFTRVSHFADIWMHCIMGILYTFQFIYYIYKSQRILHSDKLCSSLLLSFNETYKIWKGDLMRLDTPASWMGRNVVSG